MKKAIFYTIADENNLPYAKGLEASFKKFHKNIPFKIYGPEYCAKAKEEDNDFFYKATPWIARELLEEYELVVKMDADSVVCGNLDHIIKDETYGVGVVSNYSKSDLQLYGAVAVWDIKPEEYFNCGLVAMRDKNFVNNWFRLCQSDRFRNYRYREQDLLNILCHYGDYKVKLLDNSELLNGLLGKDLWHASELENKNIVVKFRADDGAEVAQRTIKVIHWGGGNASNKMAFETKFTTEVAEYLRELTKYE